jgi:hypothetical protein
MVAMCQNKIDKEMIENKKPAQDDWRRQGQEKYLKGVKLVFQDFHPYRKKWDHDHCEFCGNKFSLNEGDLKKGYSTKDSYRWICGDCFKDFNEEFDWTIEDL